MSHLVQVGQQKMSNVIVSFIVVSYLIVYFRAFLLCLYFSSICNPAFVAGNTQMRRIFFPLCIFIPTDYLFKCDIIKLHTFLKIT